MSFVHGMIDNELTAMDAERYSPSNEEPLVTFSVRVHASNVGQLQALANYFGESRTAFASRLLEMASQEAWQHLIEREDERGNGQAVREALGGKIEFETEDGGKGWAQSSLPTARNTRRKVQGDA